MRNKNSIYTHIHKSTSSFVLLLNLYSSVLLILWWKRESLLLFFLVEVTSVFFEIPFTQGLLKETILEYFLRTDSDDGEEVGREERRRQTLGPRLGEVRSFTVVVRGNNNIIDIIVVILKSTLLVEWKKVSGVYGLTGNFVGVVTWTFSGVDVEQTLILSVGLFPVLNLLFSPYERNRCY